MKSISSYEFWFLVGSQQLYGKEALQRVSEDAKRIVEYLNTSGNLPCPLVLQPPLTCAPDIKRTMERAMASQTCAGVICWMHTFSPAKMWIGGLSVLNKPLLQLHTQFNELLPFESIDMDFMNLNQSAHGDREFGYITARMDLPRKVISGHWRHETLQKRVALWMRAACAFAESSDLIIARFGDNMRDVAVTDGDRVEAMRRFGWSVPSYGIGDLVEYEKGVSEDAVDTLMDEYAQSYQIANHGNSQYFFEQTREQARIELALEAFLRDVGARAFCTNFEELHGMRQLPGLAVQRLMAKGYGFAGEGDWKTAALVRLCKVMGEHLPGGASFMEDYTYHLEEGNMLDLGAHMLEVCPSITSETPTLEVHPLAIGGREDPARLVFNARPGNAVCAAIVDMGNRFRMVVNEVESVVSPKAFAKLPVARVVWKPLPDLITASEAWILAGGGHHTAYADNLDLSYFQDFAEMAAIECITIGKGTTIDMLRKELHWNEAYWNTRR